MSILQNVVRALLKSALALLVISVSGCASLDPFADDARLSDRAAAYPTLQRPREPQPEPPEQSQRAENRAAAAFTGARQRAPQAQIFRGRPLATSGSAAKFSNDSLVLNFENASINEAAALILGEFLGQSFEVHPAVSGVINLRSADALEGEAALGAFETVLRQNNAALVSDNGLYRIVPETLALGYASAPQIGTGRPLKPGYAVQIVPLQFVAAQQMAEIIKPLAAQDAVIRVDTDRNLLLMAGSGQELNLWLETVRTFDIDWFAGKSVGVFPLRQVSAAQVVKELEAIFAEGSETQTIRFLPIERTNAVMAITRAGPLLNKVRAWTERLDADSGAARRLRVYAMKNAKASDVAPLLQEIFNAPREDVGRQPAVAPGETPVSASSPGVVAASTAPARRPQQARNALSSETLRIIPDEAANTLLIMATQEEFERMREALRQLDVAPLQVLVEATIAEVTITDDLRYGVQYFLEGSIANESAIATLSSAASSTILPSFPGASLVLGEPAQVVLDALEGITDINVISSPNLMVLDNQTARLTVGDQIPVTVQNVTNGFTSGESDPILFNAIEFRDTGIIFEVTPRISSDGAVTLDIVQEVSNVSGSGGTTLTPTISQRRIESSVVAQSGQTIVLGGLFSDNSRRGRSGIPILSRAPLFGGLFSNTETTETRTELVVLIQPRILRNAADARAITREFQDRITGLRLLSPSRDDLISQDRPIDEGVVAPSDDFKLDAAPLTPVWPSEPESAPPVEQTAEATPAPVAETRKLNGASDAEVLRQPAPLGKTAEKNAEILPLRSAAPLRSASLAPPLRDGRTSARFFVQFGAFETEGAAQSLAAAVTRSEQSLAQNPIAAQKAGALWRVVAGPLSEEKAQSLCNGLNRPCAVVSE